MISVIIPMAVLIGVILIKKIPYIGGNINVALVLTGALTLLMAGIVNPGEWFSAWISGINTFAWIISMSIVGSLFAEMSLRMGTIDTIIGAFSAKFGNHPRILIVCILFTLCLAGSLLGDAIAAAAVIGMIAVGILASMNLSLEKISAIIVMGACVGSIMPPMTQAIALSCTLVGADPDVVMKLGYLVIGVIFVFVALYCAFGLMTKDNKPGANPDVEIKYIGQSAGDILRSNWKSLVPLVSLIIIVLLRTIDIPYISVDLGPSILKNITVLSLNGGETTLNLYEWMSSVTILSGLTNGVVMSMICATIVAMFFPVVHNNMGDIISSSFSKVKTTVLIQLSCAFMIGSFYSAGSIEIVSQFCQTLDSNMLKIGGIIAMLLMGMLTGSQSTAQNVVFSFFGPALVATGMTTTTAAMAGACLAFAGQGLPPADLTTFVVAGIVSAQFGRKVDPVKSMIYSAPMCIAFLVMGSLFLFVL